MMRSTEQQCDLCLEVENLWELATGSSLLIYRDSFFDVISGLGALAQGYVLLVPRDHVRSIGELDEFSVRRIYRAAWCMANKVGESFGRSCLVMEHGSSGDPHLPGGACIAHAHIHIFPLECEADPQYFIPPNSYQVDDVAQLNGLAQDNSNYYYCALSEKEGYLSVNNNLGHQYGRRKWADHLGVGGEWDWAAAPYNDRAVQTAERLRDSEFPPLEELDFDEEVNEEVGEDVRETIAAYDIFADQYAQRTMKFPDSSVLPDEIKRLARETKGRILDAGCGAGRDALEFSKLDRKVIALDASSRLLRHVPKNENITRMKRYIWKTRLATGSVGAIWCSAVLLHLEREKAVVALREMCRVLAVDGLMEVSIKGGTGHSRDPVPGHQDYQRHFYYYSVQEMEEMAVKAGFEVKEQWIKEEPDSGDSCQQWIKLLLGKNSSTPVQADREA
jgi:SAM-dependent methyltransferase/diadenosine tetraphosphate (Ap4A) HIT family hydrolase